MKKLVLIVLFAFLFLMPTSALAYDPTSLPNNSYGIHIANPVDLKDAASLVNSNGGQWGYVTFVINQNELDHERWQKVFDEARRLKVIPIVRVASDPDGGVWTKT